MDNLEGKYLNLMKKIKSKAFPVDYNEIEMQIENKISKKRKQNFITNFFITPAFVCAIFFLSFLSYAEYKSFEYSYVGNSIIPYVLNDEEFSNNAVMSYLFKD